MDERVVSHLWRMRLTWGLFLATVPIAMVAGVIVPRRVADAASPMTVTLLAVAGSLWVALTADRDARFRLDRAKRAFAVHGDVSRLLRDHWLVFLIVMSRLGIVVVCSVVVAVWGVGVATGIWIALLGGVMMALAWPSAHKTELLIERGRELRNGR